MLSRQQCPKLHLYCSPQYLKHTIFWRTTVFWSNFYCGNISKLEQLSFSYLFSKYLKSVLPVTHFFLVKNCLAFKIYIKNLLCFFFVVVHMSVRIFRVCAKFSNKKCHICKIRIKDLEGKLRK